MICHKCDKQVNGKKKFNWLLFLVLWVTGIGPFIYLIYYFFMKKHKCELCGSKI